MQRLHAESDKVRDNRIFTQDERERTNQGEETPILIKWNNNGNTEMATRDTWNGCVTAAKQYLQKGKAGNMSDLQWEGLHDTIRYRAILNHNTGMTSNI